MIDFRDIEPMVIEAGAVAAAVCDVGIVEDAVAGRFSRWLADGGHAGMGYMADWLPLRIDPRRILDGARSVICTAFAYRPVPGIIASYALGLDYHDVIRRRLSDVVSTLKERYGGEYRICVDSAPVLERYWAERSGLGRRCRNGLIYVPGAGQRVFLAEILTTNQILSYGRNTAEKDGERDKEDSHVCPEGCRRCIDACPAGALQEDGTVCAGSCLSYLTIEHRGDWDGEGVAAMRTPAGRRTLYGCDICQRVCPLNSALDDNGIMPELEPRENIAALTPEDVVGMTQEDFSRIFKGSAIKRAKLAGLRRNALNMLGEGE